jgi:hypothetical protein
MHALLARPVRPLWPAIAVLLLAWSPPLDAQSRGSLEVEVRAADGAPLAGAVVTLDALGMQGVTDLRGLLTVHDLQPGPQRLRVRFLGYAPHDAPVQVRGGQTARIVVALETQPIPLAAVEVRARQSLLVSHGFYERSRGTGTFVTREQIERMRPRYLSDVLRQVAGIRIGPEGRDGLSPASIRGQQRMVGSCPIQFFVDGTYAAFFNIDEIRPEWVEGIEIYRGAASIPAMFNRGSAMCGVIVVWTRM